MQRRSKQVSAAIAMQATIEEFLGMMFSVQSVQSGYKKSSVENSQSSSRDPSKQLVES
jgi:hypothetical protein